jgi:hypothetical protein
VVRRTQGWEHRCCQGREWCLFARLVGTCRPRLGKVCRRRLTGECGTGHDHGNRCRSRCRGHRHGRDTFTSRDGGSLRGVIVAVPLRIAPRLLGGIPRRRADGRARRNLLRAKRTCSRTWGVRALEAVVVAETTSSTRDVQSCEWQREKGSIVPRGRWLEGRVELGTSRASPSLRFLLSVHIRVRVCILSGCHQCRRIVDAPQRHSLGSNFSRTR